MISARKSATGIPVSPYLAADLRRMSLLRLRRATRAPAHTGRRSAGGASVFPWIALFFAPSLLAGACVPIGSAALRSDQVAYAVLTARQQTAGAKQYRQAPIWHRTAASRQLPAGSGGRQGPVRGPHGWPRAAVCFARRAPAHRPRRRRAGSRICDRRSRRALRVLDRRRRSRRPAADPAEPLPAAGRVLARHEAEPGRELAPGAEAAGSATVAAMAVAISGPMPGTVASRRLTSSTL